MVSHAGLLPKKLFVFCGFFCFFFSVFFFFRVYNYFGAGKRQGLERHPTNVSAEPRRMTSSLLTSRVSSSGRMWKSNIMIENVMCLNSHPSMELDAEYEMARVRVQVERTRRQYCLRLCEAGVCRPVTSLAHRGSAAPGQGLPPPPVLLDHISYRIPAKMPSRPMEYASF